MKRQQYSVNIYFDFLFFLEIIGQKSYNLSKKAKEINHEHKKSRKK